MFCPWPGLIFVLSFINTLISLVMGRHSAFHRSRIPSLSPPHNSLSPRVVLQRIPEIPFIQENAPSSFRSATRRSTRHVFPTSTSPAEEPIDFRRPPTRRSNRSSLPPNRFGYDSEK